MAYILSLETATTNCSVGISNAGETIALVEENTPNYSHSKQLHLFIEKAVSEAGLTLADIDAVAVSKGPGSYTGLRIGVSAAKGLCFSLDIPLISVATLESMAHQVQTDVNAVLIPVLDARRMEVYSCVFSSDFTLIRETRAEVLNERSFADYLEFDKVHLLGNGAEKCKQLFRHESFIFHTEIVPSAGEMSRLAFTKFMASQFEDVAYFEPYYLKDFVLQKKKG